MVLADCGTAVELCFAVNVLFSGWVLLHDGVRQTAFKDIAKKLTDALAGEWPGAQWIAGACQILRIVAVVSGAFFATAIYVGILNVPNESLPQALPNGMGTALEPYWSLVVWCACYLSAAAVLAMQVISRGFGILAGMTVRFANRIKDAHRARADIEALMANMNETPVDD